MKKIINSKKYDTDTATLLKSMSIVDSHYEATGLFKKNNGEYFVVLAYEHHGFWNGKVTDYLDGKIIPVDEKTAKSWAEEYMTVDEYEAEFGIVEE